MSSALTPRDQLYIARCMMLGCEFVYNNSGHPARKHARDYYQCISGSYGWWIGWGTSEAEAARDYLQRYNPELLNI